MKLLPENSDSVLSKLETLIIVPALNISTFMKYCTVETLVSYRYFIVTSTILITIAIFLSYPLSRIFEKGGYQRNIYKYALTFANHGFLGNAIVPLILGEEFLFPYMLFCLPINAATYTWGLSNLIPKSGNKHNALKSLLNPCVISILIGAVIGLSGLVSYIPSFLTLSLTNISACMGPLAMILTGFVAAKFNLFDLLKKPKIYIATFLRLIVLPTIFITALYFLKVDREIIIMSLFAFATPLGLNTVVFPAAYGQDTSTGASMALISHTLCVITIPLLYVLTITLLKI